MRTNFYAFISDIIFNFLFLSRISNGFIHMNIATETINCSVSVKSKTNQSNLYTYHNSQIMIIKCSWFSCMFSIFQWYCSIFHLPLMPDHNQPNHLFGTKLKPRKLILSLQKSKIKIIVGDIINAIWLPT